MFDLNEDFYDENKTEEIELNCPWTVTVPSRASQDFMITKLRWSFQHTFRPTTNIYPIEKPAYPIIFDIKRETLAFAKVFITLTLNKKCPEPHLTQHDFHVLRKLMDTAKFLMGCSNRLLYTRNKEDSTATIQLKVVIPGGARTQSLQLVVPAFITYN